ncbi:UNVERIFIED_ORG: beta-glucosidase [Burkholderia sp. CF145]
MLVRCPDCPVPIRLFVGLAAVFIFAIHANAGAAQSDTVLPYKNPKLPVETRLNDVLQRLTLAEKVSLLSGADWMETHPVERLGIPALKMVDGPLGVRAWAASSAETNAPNSQFTVNATAFPAGIALAASWNPDLGGKVGRAIAQQAKALGRDMLLGPTININRMPLWGRNFESFGEDPYLTGRIAVGYVRGVQSEGVVATLKHLVANNSEWERRRINEQIDDRTLHEIYLPAFKAAVQEGGAWAVMSAYNKVNGKWSSENGPMLDDTLRKQWGFKGLTVSDWASTYSTADAVNAGLDLEMPGGPRAVKMITAPNAEADAVSGLKLTSEKVLAELDSAQITAATIDERAGNILRVIIANGLLEHQHQPAGELDTPAQRAIARQAATESIVLLKNDSALLPLDSSRIRSIAVIGPAAGTAITGGGGSSLVRPKYTISPLEGIREGARSTVQVQYALGASMEGEKPENDRSVERAKQLREAVELAAKSDVVVLVVGRSAKIESEAFDLPSMDLPPGQNELIEAVTEVNPRTIVVLNTGNPVTMKWLSKVPALLDMWYGGQEGGRALASVLFGETNPAAKLPVTFPKAWEDSPVYGNYPGDRYRQTKYQEGIYVGYRYYDAKGIEPLFPFGYGLSYTTFEYSGIKVNAVRANGDHAAFTVSVAVRNTGKRAGAEVVQMYVHDGHSKSSRPVRELKGFQRVDLDPGETKVVKFSLNREALSYYNAEKSAWIAEPGEFTVEVGSSSRDIRQEAILTLKE